MESIIDEKTMWEFIERTYDIEQQIIIEDFLSYFENEYCGYGHHNDQNLYRENKETDSSGELFAVAQKWFSFTKQKIRPSRFLRRKT